MGLERQVARRDPLVGADLGDDLGDHRVDLLEPELAGDRDPVVAVDDEVQGADPVDVDRRHVGAAAHRGRDPLPAPADPVRGRAEAAVELAARAVDRADDRVELDRLEPEPALAAAPERLDDLVEGKDQVDVVGLAAKPRREAGELVAAPCAAEVGLRVLGGKAGVHRRRVRCDDPTRGVARKHVRMGRRPAAMLLVLAVTAGTAGCGGDDGGMPAPASTVGKAQGAGSISSSDSGERDPAVLAGTLPLLNGEPQDLAEYRGEVVLVVNTATECGFTPQFERPGGPLPAPPRRRLRHPRLPRRRRRPPGAAL